MFNGNLLWYGSSVYNLYIWCLESIHIADNFTLPPYFSYILAYIICLFYYFKRKYKSILSFVYT